jgi:hypothetical protein
VTSPSRWRARRGWQVPSEISSREGWGERRSPSRGKELEGAAPRGVPRPKRASKVDVARSMPRLSILENPDPGVSQALVPKSESGRAPGPRQPEPHPHQARGSGSGTSTNPRVVQVAGDGRRRSARRRSKSAGHTARRRPPGVGPTGLARDARPGLPLEPLLQRLVDADVAPLDDGDERRGPCSTPSRLARSFPEGASAGSFARPGRPDLRAPAPRPGIYPSSSIRPRSRRGHHELHGDRWLAGVERGSRDRVKGDGSGFEACGRDPASRPAAR